MSRYILQAIVLGVLTLVNVCQSSNSQPSVQLESPRESERNEKELLKILWPQLKAAGDAGRVYFTALCQKDDKLPIAFPQFDVQPPPSRDRGLAAVRDMFRNDSSVTVTENEPGIIRIWFRSVPDAILQTKISSLRLGPIPQYNPVVAIQAIENAPEVQSAMRTLGVRTLEMPINMLVGGPADGRLHIPGSMNNVTMDEALDTVARTFKGIVLYGACTQPELYTISFTGGVYYDDSWLTTGD
jgi:hypothetical protein